MSVGILESDVSDSFSQLKLILNYVIFRYIVR